MFPSPYGELHFSIRKKCRLKNWRKVSVPLRGTTFLNAKGDSMINARIVSVPLRGTTFLNPKTRRMKIWSSSFRPLTGNYISQWKFGIHPKYLRVSVPLRGTTFLNTGNGMYRSTFRTFPSPYGELHFSICKIGIKKKKGPRFRPLTGNYISQWYRNKPNCFFKLEFPSPYGELHFSMIWWSATPRTNSVSVPLRGTTFLNTISHTSYILWLICPKCVWKKILRNVVSWNPKKCW